MRETKRARRARQRRSDHRQAVKPTGTAAGQPQYGDHSQPPAPVADIAPFDDLEELG